MTAPTALFCQKFMKTVCSTLLLMMIFGLGSVESTKCECSNKILMLLRYDDFRIITSPDYPQIYCPDMICAWRIVAPENYSQIHFFAKNIDLRDNHDFIHFFESKTGMDLDSELNNATFTCTGRTDCRFKSSGQFLTIIFRSGKGSGNHYGFQGTVSLYDRQSTWLRSIWKILLVALCSVAFIIVVTIVMYFLVCKRYIHQQKHSSLHQEEEETIITSVSKANAPDVESQQKLVNDSF
uniref:CUB domain-containing protein n=1 Tax=Panagrolaimus sp. JU765 TaxID=591449 RepID=A0AC34RPE8_9BILA